MKNILTISKETVKKATKKLAIGAMTAAMLGAGTMSGVSAAGTTATYSSSISAHSASASTTSSSGVLCYVRATCRYQASDGNYYTKWDERQNYVSAYVNFSCTSSQRMASITSTHRAWKNSKLVLDVKK